ncbi:hypothetical protein BH10BAC6_BH10BAC6_14740 [soil metagenome]
MKRLLFPLLILVVGCAQIKDITNALNNLANVQFKLNNITAFRVAGVDVARVASLSDLSIGDALALTSAFSRKQVPVGFTLNIDAKNPNAATTRSNGSATLTGLDWRLIIDDKPTIAGDIQSPITLPGGGQTTNIPLGMQMDMYSFFGEKGYDGLLNLALALGGKQGSAARVKLDAQPTISTPIGAMKYPSRLTIIDKSFSG